jgi:hypothetical protein
MQTLTKRRINIDAERMEHYEAMSVEPGDRAFLFRSHKRSRLRRSQDPFAQATASASLDRM